MKRRSIWYTIAREVPYFGPKLKLLESCGYLPGNYYSPIPDLTEIRRRQDAIFKKNREVSGIDLNKNEQFNLLQQFAIYYKDLPYDFKSRKDSGTRYRAKETWYTNSDAIMLFCMLCHFKPARIIEVGSGFSSAIILDTNERYLNNKTTVTFIDPEPQRLLGLLKEEDKKNCSIRNTIVQDVSLDLFKTLEANDILFIDSSHISKVGSDLNYILFEVLPVLKPGVIIHFHDIYFPFELPMHWVIERKWFWNENYILRAYLTGNKEYKIINFNSFLHDEYRQWFVDNMPDCLIAENESGCIWLSKC